MHNDVAKKTTAVEAMQLDIELARALLGGTRAMRLAGKMYLPKWPKEDEEAYRCRIDTAVLFPAYQRTVQTLTGKPFSKPLTLGKDVPPQLVEWCEDIDLQGRNLDAYAADLMESALGYGVCGVLVDYPTKPEDVKTKADEQAAGLRPYLIHIHPHQIVGWRSARRNGAWVLDQLRIMECVNVEDGDFGTKDIEQIRVLQPGLWSIYRQNDKKDWVLVEEGTTTLKYIPYVPIYGQRTGFMCGKPPLIELAHMNVEHWQSASDQQTILHVARVPILFLKNLGDQYDGDGKKVEVVVGGGGAIYGNTPDADGKYIEHTGAAIGAGEASIKALEERMRQAGAELLVIASHLSRTTATQVASENEVGKCALQRVVQGLEDAIDQSLQIMAEWVGLGEGGHVTLFNDFGVDNLSDASSQLVMTMQQGGLITKKTAIREQQRRGVLSADINPDDELGLVDGEGPSLGTMETLEIEDKGEDKGQKLEPVLTSEPFDPAPIVEAIRMMAEKFVPVDLSPLLEALKNQAESTTIEMDVTPIATAVADAIRSLPAAPAQPAHTFNIDATTTVNQPEQAAPVVNMAPITVNTPDVTVTPATVNVTTPDVTVNQAPITINPPAVTVTAPIVNVAAAPAPDVTVPVNVTVEKGSGNKSGTMVKQADGSYAMTVKEQ